MSNTPAEDIRLLTGKLRDLDALRTRERRDFTAIESKLYRELQGAIHELRLLPAHSPLTKPGPYGSGMLRTGGPFPSFGEQLVSIRNAAVPGGQTDARLYQVRAASGLSESVPSDSGFLVQQDFSDDLLGAAFETGVLASRCRRIQISGNANRVLLNAYDETSRVSSRFGGIVSYWTGEAAQATATKPKFRQMELILKKLIGLCYASDELLVDSTALGGVIRDAFISEFGFQLDDCIVNGTGATQPMGFLNAGSLVSVAAEAGQKAATIVAENVIKMYSRLLPGSDATSVWLINRNALPQLLTMSIAVGTGGVPVYQPANGVSGLPYNTLFGRPVLAIEQAATLGTVGDIMLCDLANGYVLAEKGGIATASSVHVRFDYDESVFRFVLRVDGQPTLAAPITPYRGGAGSSLSHFVALASRS